MKSHRTVAFVVAAALAAGATQSALIAAGQQTASIIGTAKNEASSPYTDYTVQARDIQQGQIAATATLNSEGNFSLLNLSSAKYVVELLNKDQKIICTEGPFDLTQRMVREKVNIDCDRVPAAWWLLGAAGAAGVTAGIVAAGGPASPAQ
jgi:hypothetical protein